LRTAVTTILEVAGLVAVSVGAFTVNLTVGLLTTGAIAVAAGYLLED
jgi:hypothetical protein